MALSTVASILLGIGLLLALLAVWLWIRAWRGRVTSWRSCCSRCGFELRGLNPRSTVCPECGANLQAAAALRPATRQRDPRRWAAAIAITLPAAALLWLGNVPRLVQGGNWLCRLLPTGALIDLLPHAPRMAGPQLCTRLAAARITPEQMPALQLAAASAALDSPHVSAGDAARLLRDMQQAHLITPAQLPPLLERCLTDVQLHAGAPKPCKPGGALVATVTLPTTQATTWITRDELRLSIQSVQAQLGEAPAQSLERLTRTGQSGTREFDGSIFRAPATPGRYACTMTVRMESPGDTTNAFRMEAPARFELLVIDPASIHVQFVSNQEYAGSVRMWLEMAKLDVDEATGRIVPSLPSDVGPLQRPDIAVASRLTAVQGANTVDLGRVWIDPTIPTIALNPAPLPATIDRSQPIALVLAPDADFATLMTSTDCNVLADRVEVPMKLPPAPKPPEPAPSAPTVPPPASTPPPTAPTR